MLSNNCFSSFFFRFFCFFIMSQGLPSVQSYDADKLLPNTVALGTFSSKYRYLHGFLFFFLFFLAFDLVNTFKKQTVVTFQNKTWQFCVRLTHENCLNRVTYHVKFSMNTFFCRKSCKKGVSFFSFKYCHYCFICFFLNKMFLCLTCVTFNFFMFKALNWDQNEA